MATDEKWRNNKLTRLLNIAYPIFQGPFGRGGSTPELVAAVSNGGALGGYGANELDAADIRKVGAQVRALTSKPFSMNLWVSTFDQGGDSVEKETFDLVMEALEPYYRELNIPRSEIPSGKPRDFNSQVEAMLEVKPALFSFVFGIPEENILQECRKRGIITAGAATTVEEAVACANAGVDTIVASGFEAGGHRPSFLKPAEDSLVGSLALVPQIVDAVDIPVIAAGGIADGRGVAAVIKLGAAAAQVGTAFLVCDESGASAMHKEILLSKEAANTGLTSAFTGRLARGIYNRFAADLKPLEPSLAKYPAQGWILADLKAAAIKNGRHDLLNLWAGQAAPLIKHRSAAVLLQSLIEETDQLLR